MQKTLVVSLSTPHRKDDYKHKDGKINYNKFVRAYMLRDEASVTTESPLRTNEENSKNLLAVPAKDQYETPNYTLPLDTLESTL